MKELAHRALNLAQLKGAAYGDIMIIHLVTERIDVKNGVVEGLSLNRDQGFGIRVLVDGAWGFASSSRLTFQEVEKVAAQAVEMAKASALVKRENQGYGRGEHSCKVDAFRESRVILTQKVEAMF